MNAITCQDFGHPNETAWALGFHSPEPARQKPFHGYLAGGFLPSAIRDSANLRVSNRSKADKDPTEWLPPYAGYRCTYVTTWIADRTRYHLSIAPAEQAALAERLAACPDQAITVALAR
ncbi:hypothetical protein ABT404_08115 [Streptomyces hyaluromycini]|uniref:Secreted protein n=1 Tax=Streptomyces hyaluromycini TaxID=1377993 RepID=A0ABV1WRI7_9ACTN